MNFSNHHNKPHFFCPQVYIYRLYVFSLDSQEYELGWACIAAAVLKGLKHLLTFTYMILLNLFR